MFRRISTYLMVIVFPVALFLQSCGKNDPGTDPDDVDIFGGGDTTTGDTFTPQCADGNSDGDLFCNSEEGDVDGSGALDPDETDDESDDTDGDGESDNTDPSNGGNDDNEDSGFVKFLKSDFMTGVYIVGGTVAAIWAAPKVVKGSKAVWNWGKDQILGKELDLDFVDDGKTKIPLRVLYTMGIDPGNYAAQIKSMDYYIYPGTKGVLRQTVDTYRWKLMKRKLKVSRNSADIAEITIVSNYLYENLGFQESGSKNIEWKGLKRVQKWSELEEYRGFNPGFMVDCASGRNVLKSPGATSTKAALTTRAATSPVSDYDQLGIATGTWVRYTFKDGSKRCVRYDEQLFGFEPVANTKFSIDTKVQGFNVDTKKFYTKTYDETADTGDEDTKKWILNLIPYMDMIPDDKRDECLKLWQEIGELDADQNYTELMSKLSTFTEECAVDMHMDTDGHPAYNEPEEFEIEGAGTQAEHMCLEFSYPKWKNARQSCVACVTATHEKRGSDVADTLFRECTWDTGNFGGIFGGDWSNVSSDAEEKLFKTLIKWCKEDLNKPVDKDGLEDYDADDWGWDICKYTSGALDLAQNR